MESMCQRIISGTMEGYSTSLFNWSPWFTTLISVITGTFTISLLVLTCRHYRVNASVRLKECISTVQGMILRKYWPLKISEGIEMGPCSGEEGVG
jgi:phage shock protein PspC (stress-responsive transcriptional regulator)